ncbi:ABC transporter ATP-binding protein [Phaeovulum sp. W22_SRMD_FR3]|uniref:ABC transporter ATP-binding protein n=1 Tax=Phaeovulum sp. W22_SRMD_FR3 TaxID=3240274 RepID=UPI003F9A3836
MANLTLRNVRKSYGNLPVLHGINLDIQAGEFVAFVGPSGCGKSTLLRCIAGLEDISSGELRIGGTLMNHVPPAERGIAMVFQSYALYPHMTVFQNMAFGMQIAGLPKAEIAERVQAAADKLQLTPFLQRHPKALSGGQRQRVAIGRAIVRDPKVFLFDEPLSNLDAALRAATRVEIAKLKKSMPETTMIYVTHDQVEAMTLADRIVVLRGGKIEQIGRPIDLYRHPANLFVAGFIGSPAMNVLAVTLEAAAPRPVFRLADGTALRPPLDVPRAYVGGQMHLGIRPEDLRLCTGETALLQGQISLIEQLGEVQIVHVEVAAAGQGAAPLIVKVPGMAALSEGMRVGLNADPAAMRLFDAEGAAVALQAERAA